MLDVAGAQLEYQRYAALDGELPADVSECDAWLLTGSKFAAYESDQWIADLKDFVRHAFDVGAPLLGICFGHQLMAAALGGEVRKSEKGWGVGVHRYELNDAPAWLGEHPDTLAIQAFHQDQVTVVPPDATVLARSDFCEVAALGYGDQALSVICAGDRNAAPDALIAPTHFRVWASSSSSESAPAAPRWRTLTVCSVSGATSSHSG